jgi:TM2 domain-containing membrane protein YozV
MKNKTTALILSVLVGGLGIDRFYLGYTGMGILKLLTAGCFGILYIIDIINIATGNLRPADGTPYADENKASEQSSASTISAAEELKKYKELLDQGVINEEEFQAKKERLLNLL